MPNSRNRLNPIVQSLSILILGLGVGWLSGLSISPVIEHVLGALLGLGAGIVAGIRTIKRPDSEQAEHSLFSVSTLPAALLVLGIALGAPLGILARTHAIFGVAGLKDQLKPAATVAPYEQGAAVLYDSHTTECSEFLGAESQEVTLRQTMRNSKTQWAKILADNETNYAVLKSVMESICAP
jgi:hypothetical protein